MLRDSFCQRSHYLPIFVLFFSCRTPVKQPCMFNYSQTSLHLQKTYLARCLQSPAKTLSPTGWDYHRGLDEISALSSASQSADYGTVFSVHSLKSEANRISKRMDISLLLGGGFTDRLETHAAQGSLKKGRFHYRCRTDVLSQGWWQSSSEMEHKPRGSIHPSVSQQQRHTRSSASFQRGNVQSINI